MKNFTLPLAKKDCVSDLCSDDCYEIVISIGKLTCSELQDKNGYNKDGLNKDVEKILSEFIILINPIT